jgi:eukaryotic-like serine/threonine-protein kinase
MLLWNDYEGKTIANTFSLGPLVRPEGRSALFALAKGDEAPALIRLTESINDESQMLACWSRVSQVKQENLVAIKRFGETNFEGTPLTYAVMESADANLDDLLKERPLTPAEAQQVATSVVAALKALHAKNLVHEHVVAANVLAVGEMVKLRTDCVRECVEDGEFTTAEDCARLRQQDVRDLGTLLLRALTLEKELKPGVKLPAPFNRIIPNAIDGPWGLEEIERLLAPPTPAPVAAAPAVPTVGPVAAVATPSKPSASAPATPAATVAARATPLQPEFNFTPEPKTKQDADAQLENPLRFQRRLHTGNSSSGRRAPLLAGLTVIAVVILVMVVHFTRASSSTVKPVQTTSQPAPQVIARNASARPSAPVAPASVRGANVAPSSMPAGWYVIAYTFNRAEQATIRAAAIARKNPAMHPKIVAPGGHSPYLIALGGPMTRPQAEALQKRARQSGLPRDTFIRNYRGD